MTDWTTTSEVVKRSWLFFSAIDYFLNFLSFALHSDLRIFFLAYIRHFGEGWGVFHEIMVGKRKGETQAL